MHDHFWPDIDEALHTLDSEFWQSWSQCHTPHNFLTNDPLGLSTGKRQPWGPHHQQQSSGNQTFCPWTTLIATAVAQHTIWLQLKIHLPVMHKDLHIRYRCVQSFNSLGEYLWVCKGWVFVRRFIVAEWLRYMLLITSDLTPHKTGNMSSMPQNYLHSYSMLKQLLQD